jgi:hypothetical protein
MYRRPEVNNRSRIEMRWSTDPSVMGYGPGPAPITLPGEPDYISSPRKVLTEAARVECNIGYMTKMRVEFRHQGHVVERRELEDIIHQHADR